MIEHCIAALRVQTEEKSWRVYITDALKAIAENTSHYLIPGIGVVDHGTVLTARWTDATKQTEKEEEEPEEDRSCGEIAHDMWQRIRGG